MIGSSRPILIVANSAGMLAEAAQKAGFRPLVADQFGDLDVMDCAAESQQLSSLAKNHLLPAIDHFIEKYAVTELIYGSGFERYPDTLRTLGNRLTVYGNPADVFEALQDKRAFFTLLDKLQVPYPEVAFGAPNLKLTGEDANWLVKPMQGQGGLGIRRYLGGEITDPGVYWQKFQEGAPHSVLFLADGNRSQVIGFNRQWAVSLNERDEFIFSGVINHTGLSTGQKSQICGWLDKLVSELSLKGLNSLDFIQEGQASYALEINPRPPASMQLYEGDLLRLHIEACQGKLPKEEIKTNAFCGYQVVYANRHVVIPENFTWPQGAGDIPRPGTAINTHQPICSMIARKNQPEWVVDILNQTQELILNQLDRFQHYGIQRQRQ